MNPQTEELAKRATAELKASQAQIALNLDAASALVLCGALQLALRHEEFRHSNSAQLCRSIVGILRDELKKGNPNLAQVIELGDQQQFDA